MVISKEICRDYKKFHEEAIKFAKEENKKVAIAERSQYVCSACELLMKLKADIVDALASIRANNSDCGNDAFMYQILLAYVCCDLGVLYLITTESDIGEQLLIECVQFMEPWKNRSEGIVPYMSALNELGIKQANRSEFKGSIKYLKQAERAFNEFKQEKGVIPVIISDIIEPKKEADEPEGPKELEKLYTICSFYLAEVYGQLGKRKKSVKYCHMSLRRIRSNKSFEYFSFALTAMNVAEIYIKENRFNEARHHLVGATLIMAYPEEKINSLELTPQQRANALELSEQRIAQVALCWSSYGLALLKASKDRLIKGIEEKSPAADTNQYNEVIVSVDETLITADYCLTFDEAKPVYCFVIEWLHSALEYYKPEQHLTEYAHIHFDYADLYQNMAFFHKNRANQYKMQKCRAQYFEDLLKLLNPLSSMTLCRKCWHGAGHAYLANLDITLSNVKPGCKLPPQAQLRINHICQKSIEHFKDFVKSFMENDSYELKANLDLKSQRAALNACYILGRLYRRSTSANKSVQLEIMNNCLLYHTIFTDECNSRKYAAEWFPVELVESRKAIKCVMVAISEHMYK